MVRILPMASLWKDSRSRFWQACFTDCTGKQRKNSTKIEATERNRSKAMKVAEELEKAHAKRCTTDQIMRTFSTLVKEVTGEDVATANVSAFFASYLQRRKREISPATFAAYKAAADKFTLWLGQELELHRVERSHVLGFRDSLAATHSTGTVNNTLKCLRIFFADAKRERLLFENPCESVATLKKERNATQRRGFTLDELKRVLDEVEGTEWVSLVKLGLYTAQRLGDLAALTWGQVDMQAEEIALTTQKTGRVVRVPICEPLMKHLLTLEVGDKPNAPLHPKAAALGVNHLSREFGEVLARCGFRAAANHNKDGSKAGRAGRRQQNELSFHSIRHSAVSMMKNAGMSPAVVQDLVGHESAEMSAHYTHIEAEAKRKALGALPVL
jgi:integrase